jgi:ribonucleoside-diphosphate reductase alpha chain
VKTEKLVMYRIVKLNGSSEAFSPQKLKLSILRAAQDAGVEVDGESTSP